VRFAEAVRLAFQTIRAQKLKSVFSAVGVFIGVAFLIGAWSIVNGMNVYMTEKFAGTLIGVNTFHLRRRPNFTPTSRTRPGGRGDAGRASASKTRMRCRTVSPSR